MDVLKYLTKEAEELKDAQEEFQRAVRAGDAEGEQRALLKIGEIEGRRRAREKSEKQNKKK